MAGALKVKSGVLGYEGDVASLQRVLRRLGADTTRDAKWRASQARLLTQLIDAFNADLGVQLDALAKSEAKRPGANANGGSAGNKSKFNRPAA